jgi:hypothetical protein
MLEFPPPNPRMPDSPRQRLSDLSTATSTSLASLSRMLGRNAAYLQQYVERGTPRRLSEDDRLKLAKHFRVDERELGARDPWSP